MTTRIVIIGGGPAGYEAALVAAGRGPDVAHVTVVDSDGIGGACVLWDCVPSKTLIASTGVRTELRRADGLGFDIAIEDARISIGQINNRVKTLARSQSADIGSQLLREGVIVVQGRGELVDDLPGMAHHRVRVTTPDGKVGVLRADVVLIATGASPRVLPSAVPDGERILNWRQLYDLTELPEHLVIVGSGVTGAEFCNAYTELGIKVTVVASRDQILPHEDSDAAAVLEAAFTERGVSLVKNARADSVTRYRRRSRRRHGRRPHRRRQSRVDDRRIGAQHVGPRSGEGRNRARFTQLPCGGQGFTDDRRGHLRGGGLHRPAAAGLGGRDAGPHRDVSRSRRRRVADQAAHRRGGGVHPPGDRRGRCGAVRDRQRGSPRAHADAAADDERAGRRCPCCGAVS